LDTISGIIWYYKRLMGCLLITGVERSMAEQPPQEGPPQEGPYFVIPADVPVIEAVPVNWVWVHPEDVEANDGSERAHEGQSLEEVQKALVAPFKKWMDVISEGVHRQLPKPLANKILSEEFYLDTTVADFQRWLGDTVSGSSKQFPPGPMPESGWILVQGNEYQPLTVSTTPTGATILGIAGHRHYVDESTRQLAYQNIGAVVSFRLMPVGRSRIHVQARCTSPLLFGYYRDLLALILTAWGPHSIERSTGGSQAGNPPARQQITSTASQDTGKGRLQYSVYVVNIGLILIFLVGVLIQPDFELYAGLVGSILTFLGLLAIRPTHDKWIAFGLVIGIPIGLMLVTRAIVVRQSNEGQPPIAPMAQTPTPTVRLTPTSLVSATRTAVSPTPTVELTGTAVTRVTPVTPTKVAIVRHLDVQTLAQHGTFKQAQRVRQEDGKQIAFDLGE
jgi:hypothetical protein